MRFDIVSSCQTYFFLYIFGFQAVELNVSFKRQRTVENLQNFGKLDNRNLCCRFYFHLLLLLKDL